MLFCRLALVAALGILTSKSLECACAATDKVRQPVSHFTQSSSATAPSTRVPDQMKFTFPNLGTSSTTLRRGRRMTTARGTHGPPRRGRFVLSPEGITDAMVRIMTTVNTLSENLQRLTEDVKAVSQDMKNHKAATVESLKRIEAAQERSSDKLTAMETSLSLRTELLAKDVQDVSNSLRMSKEKNAQRFDKIEERLDGEIKYHKQFANLSTERLTRVEASMEKQGTELAEIKREVKEALIMIRANQRLVNASTACTERVLSKIKPEGVVNIEELKRAILKQTSSAYGRAFFNVDNITEVIKEANSSGYGSVQSDSFVIDGYTARLTLVAKLTKNVVQLGVYLPLCPGPNDSLLQWPFRKNYTVIIFHPKDTSKDVQKAVTSMTTSCPVSFIKPKDKCNIGCGSYALSWGSVEQGRYIYNNSLTVGVSLLPEMSPEGREVEGPPVHMRSARLRDLSRDPFFRDLFARGMP